MSRRVLQALTGLCGLGLLAVPLGSAAQCLTPSDITPTDLQGQWSVVISANAPSGPSRWLLTLGPHPEHADSLKGTLQTDEPTARPVWVVADWDEGSLTLEESRDGQRIDATWQAQAVPGRCGRLLEGVRFVGESPEGEQAQTRRLRMSRLR